ncbi:hypothetical protein ACFXKG_30440 [Streptomyces sp. NPDC059255]|uniref:hypothetical protein n=1 Tax=Streptomyces sp. NPDC059255 TaxID=3346793 RepID=UPI00369DE3E6
MSFRAPDDWARGPKPVFADRLDAFLLTVDWTREAAFGVIGVCLLPPLFALPLLLFLLMQITSPVIVRPLGRPRTSACTAPP